MDMEIPEEKASKDKFHFLFFIQNFLVFEQVFEKEFLLFPPVSN